MPFPFVACRPERILESAGSRTMPHPRPPPCVALMITGYPISPAIRFASLKSITPSLPGTTGHRLTHGIFARPCHHRMIDSGFGPINVRPEVPQISAKLAFSERKPYPGCMASAFVTSAAAIRREHSGSSPCSAATDTNSSSANRTCSE